MESKNVWQQILGRKNLGSKFFRMKIRGAKWGTNFLKEIFLGGNFGEHVLEEQILLGRKFCKLASKIFGEFFASKKSFGGRKEYWEAKLFWRKDMGSKKT